MKWEETCRKCVDGEIEPTFCRYYGEPNGCNSPTYGEHPNEILEWNEDKRLTAVEALNKAEDVLLCASRFLADGDAENAAQADFDGALCAISKAFRTLGNVKGGAE